MQIQNTDIVIVYSR